MFQAGTINEFIENVLEWPLPLAKSSVAGHELNPGDRVEGLGNFGKPVGQFGTVEQANQEDAVVKWDEGGRMRLGRLWLKKVQNSAGPNVPILPRYIPPSSRGKSACGG